MDEVTVEAEVKQKHAVQPGDLVRLRSGGPLMTAGFMHLDNKKKFEPNPNVTCYWYEESRVNSTYIAMAALMVEKKSSEKSARA